MQIKRCAAPCGAFSSFVFVLAAAAQSPGFRPLATFGVPGGGIAEIVSATADGNTLVYSDAVSGAFGIVDVTNAAAPVLRANLPVTGEPTSVAVAGRFAVGPIRVDLPEEGQPPPAFAPGALALIDITGAPPLVPPSVFGMIPIGFQPDSVALSSTLGRLVAVVAIENEPVVVENGLVTGDDEPGNPNDVSPAGFVHVVTIDTINPAASLVVDVPLPASALRAAGCLFPDDPQPEFVTIHGTTVAVSLQENNGIAIIDIADPTQPTLVRVFSTGVASERLTDLAEDERLSFVDGYPSAARAVLDPAGNPVPAGARCPDAIAFSADGALLYSADEGEFNFTGGRGFSAWRLDGTLAWDDAGALEAAALRISHFPEGRAENKGIEIEGITTARFGAVDYAFIERDKEVGASSTLKKIYGFTLLGRRADADGVPDASDTLLKIELADVLADFFPYEKIEGLALTANGEFWVGLDNDGGEVESRLTKIVPATRTATATSFAASCTNLTLGASIMSTTPARNRLELTVAGYPTGAAGVLLVGMTRSLIAVPAPIGCDILDAVASVPLSLDASGATRRSFAVPFESGFSIALQAVSATLGALTLFDTSNGVEIRTDY